MSTLYYPRKLY